MIYAIVLLMKAHDVRNDTRQEQALLVFVRRLLGSISAGTKNVQGSYISYHGFCSVDNKSCPRIPNRSSVPT